MRPGSLFSAVLPPGAVPGDHLSAPYDALWGPGMAEDTTVVEIVAVDLDVGTRVV